MRHPPGSFAGAGGGQAAAECEGGARRLYGPVRGISQQVRVSDEGQRGIRPGTAHEAVDAIVLPQDIKSFGNYTVEVKLYTGISAKVKVQVTEEEK